MAMIRRVAVLTDFLSNLGGTEYYTTQLCLALKRHGVDVRLFCTRRPSHSVWENFLKHQQVPIVYSPVGIIGLRRLPERVMCSMLHSYFRYWRPDIIHANPMGALPITWLSRAFHPSIPVVGTEYSEASPRCRHWYEPDLLDQIQRFSAILTTCERSREGVKEYFGYRGPIFVVPHLVSPPNSPVVDLPDPPYHLACITRLSVEKGLDYLIAAMLQIINTVPSATLSIYGHGEDQQRLLELVRCLGLEQCVFLKGTFLPILETDQVINSHAIFVQPSLFESIPTSLIEIIAHQRVVIATAVGGVLELGTESGIAFVPPADTNSLAEAIKTFLEHPEELTARGAVGRKFYMERYNYDAVLKKLLSIYDAITLTH